MSSSFRAGGLASSLDTNLIIDQLVALRRKPIEKLEAAKKIADVKLSVIASLRGKLEAFAKAVENLGSAKARSVQAVQTPASLQVATTGASTPGRFAIEVNELAAPARARSAGFLPSETLAAGTLGFDVEGASFSVAVPAGATLNEVAQLIRDSGAPVTASVVFDGTRNFLSVTRQDTGYSGATADSALTLSDTGTGLGLSVVAEAKNASFSVDGLAITRRSNTVSDVLPGTTLTLIGKTTAPQDLVLADDDAKTKEKLQAVVAAYNAVLATVQSELDIKAETDRAKTLGGEPALRIVQSRMKALVSQEIGTGGLRSLADLGVRSDRTGALSIDGDAFARAMRTEPGAIDRLLQQGLSAAVKETVEAFTSSDGTLTLRTRGLTDEKRRIDENVSRLELRAEQYKEQLIAQFTAMETVVSSLKAAGSFLTAQQQKKGSDS